MLRSSILYSFILFLSSCGFSLDGHEEHMLNECKCVEFGTLTSNFRIEEKQGSVQPCAKQNGDSLKWGFIIDNDACEPYLPFIYDDANSFNFGLAPVKIGNYWGVIDQYGKKVIDFKYKELTSFSDSLSAYRDNNKLWGFINMRGDTVIKANFTEITPFWGNLCLAFNEQNGWRVYNSKGQLMPVQIDGLVDGFHSENRMLTVSHGVLDDVSVYNEVMEYPFYSKGERVKIVGFRNSYAVVSDTVNTRFLTIEKVLTPDKLKPIFR